MNRIVTMKLWQFVVIMFVVLTVADFLKWLVR